MKTRFPNALYIEAILVPHGTSPEFISVNMCQYSERFHGSVLLCDEVPVTDKHDRCKFHVGCGPEAHAASRARKIDLIARHGNRPALIPSSSHSMDRAAKILARLDISRNKSELRKLAQVRNNRLKAGMSKNVARVVQKRYAPRDVQFMQDAFEIIDNWQKKTFGRILVP